jgi:hypothetical protein
LEGRFSMPYDVVVRIHGVVALVEHKDGDGNPYYEAVVPNIEKAKGPAEARNHLSRLTVNGQCIEAPLLGRQIEFEAKGIPYPLHLEPSLGRIPRMENIVGGQWHRIDKKYAKGQDVAARMTIRKGRLGADPEKAAKATIKHLDPVNPDAFTGYLSSTVVWTIPWRTGPLTVRLKSLRSRKQDLEFKVPDNGRRVECLLENECGLAPDGPDDVDFLWYYDMMKHEADIKKAAKNGLPRPERGKLTQRKLQEIRIEGLTCGVPIVGPPP